MGLDKSRYYTTADIDAINAPYNIVLGERSPGKSYCVRKKRANTGI